MPSLIRASGEARTMKTAVHWQRSIITLMSSPSPTLPNEWLKYAPPPRALGPNDKWNVFLSYRSVNRSWVLNLYDILRQQGQTVFIDQCVLTAGDPLIK